MSLLVETKMSKNETTKVQFYLILIFLHFYETKIMEPKTFPSVFRCYENGKWWTEFCIKRTYLFTSPIVAVFGIRDFYSKSPISFTTLNQSRNNPWLFCNNNFGKTSRDEKFYYKRNVTMNVCVKFSVTHLTDFDCDV